MRIFQRFVFTFGNGKHRHFGFSPRSKLAGHTRLPTFSINEYRYRPVADAVRRRQSSVRQMAAFTGVHLNRWCAGSANASASFTVCWSPSITAHGTLSFGALGFPSAGWFYRNQGWKPGEHQLLAGSKARAVAFSQTVILSSTSISTSSIRRWLMPGAECPLRHDRNAGRLLQSGWG